MIVVKYSVAQVLIWLSCSKNGFLLFKVRDKKDELIPKASLESMTLNK